MVDSVPLLMLACSETVAWLRVRYYVNLCLCMHVYNKYRSPFEDFNKFNTQEKMWHKEREGPAVIMMMMPHLVARS
jgi:hypothetical protein